MRSSVQRCVAPAFSRRPFRSILVVMALSLSARPIAAQEPAAPAPGQQEATAPELTSGPLPGTPLPAANVYALLGVDAGREFDVAARIGDGPGLLLFVHELSRNTAPLISGVDRLAIRFRPLGLTACTILLAADRNEGENRLRAASGSLHMRQPMVISTDGGEGPGAYALNRRCTVTIVTAKGGKVVQSVALTDTGRADLPRLEQLVVEMTGALPEDPARLRDAIGARLPQDPARLRALVAEMALDVQHLAAAAERAGNDRRGGMQGQQRRMARDGEGAATPARLRERGDGGERPRRGAPPQDAELQRLLRRAVDRFAGAEQVAETFAAIEKRAAESDALRTETKAMLELMLDLGYGTDAAKTKAKAWLEGQAGSGK